MSATTIPGSLVKKTTTKHFLGMQSSSGNVAGVDRGATEFTMRSDIGPAHDRTEIPMDAAMQSSGPPVPKKRRGDDDGETEDLNDTNYEEVFYLLLLVIKFWL